MRHPMRSSAEEFYSAAARETTDADYAVYSLLGETPEILEMHAGGFDAVALKIETESSAACSTIVAQTLRSIAKAVRDIGPMSHEARAFMLKHPEYQAYMQRLQDKNGAASDVSRAHGRGLA